MDAAKSILLDFLFTPYCKIIITGSPKRVDVEWRSLCQEVSTRDSAWEISRDKINPPKMGCAWFICRRPPTTESLIGFCATKVITYFADPECRYAELYDTIVAWHGKESIVRFA